MGVTNSLVPFKRRNELIQQGMKHRRIGPRLPLQMLQQLLVRRIELHASRQPRQILNVSTLPTIGRLKANKIDYPVFVACTARKLARVAYCNIKCARKQHNLLINVDLVAARWAGPDPTRLRLRHGEGCRKRRGAPVDGVFGAAATAPSHIGFMYISTNLKVVC